MDNNEIGKKIKKYRQRAKMSQMELELATDAAFGSISRIENGKINPTKETLQKITEVLNLNSHEIANLFGIDSRKYIDFMATAQEILSTFNLDEVLQKAVNMISRELNLTGAIIDVVKGDELWCGKYTQSWYTDLMDKVMKNGFENAHININNNPNNFCVRVIKYRTPLLTKHIYEASYPFFSKFECNILQKLSGAKSGIIFPIISPISGDAIGVIQYGKNYLDDFSAEFDILQAFTNSVAQAMENAKLFEKAQNKV